jgi:diacylglycerol kinase (ATP)
MRVTLMHNPNAGHDSPSKEELVKALKKADYKVDYQSTKKKKWRKALEEPGDLVVVAGGDGTVAKVAAEMAGRGVPLAILPVGTANNIATSLGIQGSLKEVIAGWESASRRTFDIGTVSGPWGESRFLEAVGFGLFTQSMAMVETREEITEPEHRDEELEHGLKFLQTTLTSLRARPWKVTLDGEDLSGEYLLMEVMNIRCIGPNLCLAPGAEVDDGRLDLVLLGEDDRERFERYLESHGRGPGARLDVPVRSGERVRIHWDGSPLRIDDQIYADVSLADVGEGGGAEVEIRLDSHVELLLGSS